MGEAIQEDVSENEETEEIVETERDKQMAAIAARGLKEREDEFEEIEDVDEITEDTEVVEEDDTLPMMEFINEDGSVIKISPTATLKTNISGTEGTETVENIARSYQKGAAADERLEQASQQVRDAEAREQGLKAREAEVTKKEQAFLDSKAELDKKREAGTLSDDGYEQAGRDILKALLDTDSDNPEKEIAEALKRVAPKAETIDRAAIVAEAKESAEKAYEEREKLKSEEAWKKERESANTWFKNEYEDIHNNKGLMSVATNYIEDAMREDPSASLKDIAKVAGDKTRTWRDSLSGTTPRPRPKKTPKAANMKATVGKDVKPVKRADTIKQMKESRGQPV